jgi:hypothetical protein
LDRQRKAFEKKGVNVAAVSFDSPELLRNFAQRRDLTMTLLSDPESKVIRAFGILNTSVAETHQFHGIPNPGEYLIGPDGVVKSKYFEEKYAERFTASNILVRDLGGDPNGSVSEQKTDHLYLSGWASDQAVVGGQRFTVGIDVVMEPKMHVYAPGVEGGYIPVEFEVEKANGVEVFPATYPQSELIHLPAIDETVPVFQGSFRILADVKIGQIKDLGSLLNAKGELLLRGTFRYQACDDKLCYLPASVPLEWTVKVESHDSTRAPENLRRNAKSSGSQ